MERDKLKEVILTLDQTIEKTDELNIIPALAFLEDILLDYWLSESNEISAAILNKLTLCATDLLNSCCDENKLALPTKLRSFLFHACSAVSMPVDNDVETARLRCKHSLQSLRWAQESERVLCQALAEYSQEIISEEKEIYRQQIQILREIFMQQLMLYKCAARSCALDLRNQYTHEAESVLQAYLPVEDIIHQIDAFRLSKQMTYEKLNFLVSADNSLLSSVNQTESTKGSDGYDSCSGMDVQATGTKTLPSDCCLT